MTVAESDGSPDPLEQTTASLARGARNDQERFAVLYRRVAPSVFAWASLRLTSSLRKVIEVEDVVQEVWYRALDSLASYDPSRSSFRTWVFSIANHVILDAYRQLGRLAGESAAPRPIAEMPDDATSISQQVARDESLQRCVARLAELDAADRQLVIHCGLEGLSAAETGAILDASADAIAKRWQRLRARLRELTPFKDLLAP